MWKWTFSHNNASPLYLFNIQNYNFIIFWLCYRCYSWNFMKNQLERFDFWSLEFKIQIIWTKNRDHGTINLCRKSKPHSWNNLTRWSTKPSSFYAPSNSRFLLNSNLTIHYKHFLWVIIDESSISLGSDLRALENINTTERHDKLVNF